ncbi:MAG: sensor domain-containing diguanylate cyclase, partial [Zoogloeaceae bacterium]|nr:sensor domain-containing diguanylate cyclase [Zoogloeaceae bacterium]
AENVARAFQEGRYVFEWLHQNVEGELIPTEMTLVRVSEENRHDAVLAFMRDLREVREAEAKTIEAKNRMQLMLDESPLCCTFWDENLNSIDCNLEATRMFGVPSKQEYLARFPELSPEYQPDGRLSREAAPASVARAFKEGRYVFEWMHKNLQGEPVPTEVTLVRVEEDNGRSVVLAFMRDLRQVREAEAKTVEAQKRMQLMLDESPLCCTFWDENLNSIDCNLEATRMFGVPSKQEYLARFHELSPEYQPDGRLSKEAAPASVARAFKEGRYVFEWMHRNLQGEPVPTEVTLVRVDEDNGRSVVLAFMRDLREIKDKTAKLDVAENLAFSDSLTGANNRRLFMQRASDEFHAQENVVSHIGIIMLDIDYFKRVNDTYGHEAGDEVLKLMATTVQNTLRGTDLFARYGGEEFIILVQQLDLNDLTKLAQRICKKIENTGFFYHGIKIPLTISAGVAIRKDMSYTIEEVIKHADMALYQAKLNGRNRVEAYNGDEPKERAGCASPSSPPTDGSDYVL